MVEKRERENALRSTKKETQKTKGKGKKWYDSLNGVRSQDNREEVKCEEGHLKVLIYTANTSQHENHKN